MQQIQAGIIGLGGIGRQFLAEMQNHNHFTVASAWDPSETSRAIATTDWPDLTITENAGQILSDPSFDMIYIASPPDSHCDYILAAIDAGKASCYNENTFRKFTQCS